MLTDWLNEERLEHAGEYDIFSLSWSMLKLKIIHEHTKEESVGVPMCVWGCALKRRQ